MPMSLALNLAALATLVPAAVVSGRGAAVPVRTRWMLLGVAAAGPAVLTAAMVAPHWSTGFSTALWISVTATLSVYLVVCRLAPAALGLAGLVLPYAVMMGLFATLFHPLSGAGLVGGPPLWVGVHIAVSVLTYALLALGAIAGLAAFLKARALKARARHPGRPDGFVARLPAVVEAERLQVRLLAVAEGVLGLGILTGMSVQYYETARFLVPDHKTILSLAAFAVIAGLLVAHRWFGVGGRAAARFVLAAFLLLTLAYPGVKFVADVLL